MYIVNFPSCLGAGCWSKGVDMMNIFISSGTWYGFRGSGAGEGLRGCRFKGILDDGRIGGARFLMR